MLENKETRVVPSDPETDWTKTKNSNLEVNKTQTESITSEVTNNATIKIRRLDVHLKSKFKEKLPKGIPSKTKRPKPSNSQGETSNNETASMTTNILNRKDLQIPDTVTTTVEETQQVETSKLSDYKEKSDTDIEETNRNKKIKVTLLSKDVKPGFDVINSKTIKKKKLKLKHEQLDTANFMHSRKRKSEEKHFISERESNQTVINTDKKLPMKVMKIKEKSESKRSKMEKCNLLLGLDQDEDSTDDERHDGQPTKKIHLSSDHNVTNDNRLKTFTNVLDVKKQSISSNSQNSNRPSTDSPQKHSTTLENISINAQKLDSIMKSSKSDSGASNSGRPYFTKQSVSGSTENIEKKDQTGDCQQRTIKKQKSDSHKATHMKESSSSKNTKHQNLATVIKKQKVSDGGPKHNLTSQNSTVTKQTASDEDKKYEKSLLDGNSKQSKYKQAKKPKNEHPRTSGHLDETIEYVIQNYSSPKETLRKEHNEDIRKKKHSSEEKSNILKKACYNESSPQLNLFPSRVKEGHFDETIEYVIRKYSTPKETVTKEHNEDIREKKSSIKDKSNTSEKVCQNEPHNLSIKSAVVHLQDLCLNDIQQTYNLKTYDFNLSKREDESPSKNTSNTYTTQCTKSVKVIQTDKNPSKQIDNSSNEFCSNSLILSPLKQLSTEFFQKEASPVRPSNSSNPTKRKRIRKSSSASSFSKRSHTKSHEEESNDLSDSSSTTISSRSASSKGSAQSTKVTGYFSTSCTTNTLQNFLCSSKLFSEKSETSSELSSDTESLPEKKTVNESVKPSLSLSKTPQEKQAENTPSTSYNKESHGDSSQEKSCTDVIVHNHNNVPFNIKITRNINTSVDDRIIQIIPQSSPRNAEENEDCSSVASTVADLENSIMHSHGSPEYDDRDSGDDSEIDYLVFHLNDWLSVHYEFDHNIFRVLSKDAIFKGAELSKSNFKEAATKIETDTICELKRTITNVVKSNLTSQSNNQESSTSKEQTINEMRCSNTRFESIDSAKFLSTNNRSAFERLDIIPSDFQRTTPEQQNFEFKMPLPPAKRPPTRVKSVSSDNSSHRSRSPEFSEISTDSLALSTNSESSSVANRSLPSFCNSSYSTNHETDDAISLYAGTIKSTDFEDKSSEFAYQRESSDLLEESDPSSQDIQPQNDTCILDSNKMAESPKLPELPVHLKNKDIATWIENTTLATQHRVKERTPFIFKQMCLFNITNGCTWRQCNKSHDLPNNIQYRMKQLPRDMLLETYNFAKTKPKLYMKTVNYFIEAFEKFHRVSDVVTLVDDILNTTMLDRTPPINNVILALQRMGLSFIEAVEEIMIAQGIKNIGLSDILLYIIFQHKGDLCKNWCLVRKLTCYRNEQMVDHHLVEDIIIVCCDTRNGDLCRNLVRDIFIPENVNLRYINVTKLNEFVSLLNSLVLREEKQEMLKQMRKYMIPISMSSPQMEKVSPRSQSFPSENEGNIGPQIWFKETELIQNRQIPNLMELSFQHPYYNKETTNSPNMYNNTPTLCPPPFFKDAFALLNSNRASNKTPSNSSNTSASHHTLIVNEESSSSHLGNLNMNIKSATCKSETSVNSTKCALVSRCSAENSIYSKTGHEISFDQNLDFGLQNVERNTVADSFNNSDNYNPTMHLHHYDDFDVPMSVSTNKSRNMDRADFQYENDSEEEVSYEEYLSNLSNNSVKSSQGEGSLDNIIENSTSMSLPEYEMKKLSKIITEQNITGFISMFDLYQSSPFAESLIINTISFFKRYKSGEIYNLTFKIVSTLEQQGYASIEDMNINRTLCMLVINTVALLEQKKAYNEAARLLVKFYGNLTSLTDTKWLRSIHTHIYTEVGKYLHFCRILIRGGHIQETIDILMSPRLNLLYGTDKWELNYNETFDVAYRNDVLREAILISLKSDLNHAKRIILHLITNKDHITEINISKYFNTLILRMLDSNAHEEDLKEMLKNILQGWYKYLTKSVMRGLLVQLVLLNIPFKQKLNFFQKCCMQNIYETIKGNETQLTLETDMTKEEIYMIFNNLLYKVAKYNYPVQDITLNVKLTDSASGCPLFILNSDVSVAALKAKVYNVLASSFQFAINVKMEDHLPCVRIGADQVIDCIRYYRNLNKPPTA